MDGFYKVIQSGHIVEVYRYSKNPLLEVDTEKEKPVGRAGNGLEERKEEYRATVNYVAREKCRRMILQNFNEKSLFVTLTFREHVTDLDYANKEFKKFIQRVNRKFGKTKYVAVIEFTKIGRVHYHMICDLPITWNGLNERQKKERDLAKVWRQGFVDITDIREVDNVGAYLLKYMQKSFTDERLNERKRYLFSKGLEKPIQITGSKQELLLETLEGVYPKFTSTYENEFQGEVHYAEYNFKWGLNKDVKH